ncbi:hypothetical protein AWC38_SpisGene19889 [Stylophora pistillata]|uniref:Uncharacterized protein n=1 Tax=Stylophora pistillata TaxID=50429 RepID=A0A2B4RGB6_STYPI|nr:hypothetical protein AWC38_SpisGene19889 [Stylophora pistillata]
MSWYPPPDFVDNTCEIVKVQTNLGQHVATIFRKPPNGEFEVHGACLVRNELVQDFDWRRNRNRPYRKLRIVTSLGSVLDIKRRGTNDYEIETSGFHLTGVKSVSI